MARADRRSRPRRRRPTTCWCCATPARRARRACRKPATCRSRGSSRAQGVKDMVRISDARMSGTAFGTIVLHIAPESAVGGPLALVQNGDMIRLDVAKRRIELLVDDAELEKRRAALPPVATPEWATAATRICSTRPSCRPTKAAISISCAVRARDSGRPRPFRVIASASDSNPWRHEGGLLRRGVYHRARRRRDSLAPRNDGSVSFPSRRCVAPLGLSLIDFQTVPMG